MQSAFVRADFTRAAQIYDEFATNRVAYEAVALRARIFLKKSQMAAALQLLTRREVPKADLAAQSERELLLAVSYDRSNRQAVAEDHFEAAERAARGGRSRDLLSEIAYWRARGQLNRGRITEAVALLPEISQPGSKASRVRAFDLQTAALGRQEHYKEQAAMLMEMLEFLGHSSSDHAEFRIWATHTLAVLARELYIPEAQPLLEANLREEWPDFFRVNHFQSVKALAWCRALQGDYLNAFRHLKRAAALAQDDQPWRTMALVDRAYLAKCIGELRWSRQELDEADEAAGLVDWVGVRGEERMVVLLLAELFVPIDPSKAIYYLSLYEQMPPLRDPLLNFTYDSRLCAHANYAAGVVHIALGHRSQGLKLLRSALGTYTRIGFAWRAGRAALRIYESTRDRQTLTFAREHLSRYATSWLGEEIRALAGGGRGPELTPMQETIFREICQGRDTREIAHRLDRSYHTVRNHIKLIFKAFDVGSRTALLAEARRRGLL